MKRTCILLPIVLIAIAFPSAGRSIGVEEAAEGESHGELLNFSRDIRPILSDKCFACHGPDATHREAELRLDQVESVLADRGGYAVIVPGAPDESEILTRLRADDPDYKMPPADHEALTPEQVDRIATWIEQGATWSDHWAFIPPQQPHIPAQNDPEFEHWYRNEIDAFVLQRLRSVGLRPSAAADRKTLIRRLSLDLTGLPPTTEALDAFLNDSSPDAYARLIDRFLDSPAYGERMAVAWMDQARYADTNGYSIDGGRHMWLWRDWVINAYNQNKPFDQFVIEQLAGDLLPNATVDQRVATGFNRNHMITHEGGTIPAENLTNYAADRVKTTAEVFMGLTFGCAQCHDHKFDPITQRDYYRIFAFFNTLSDRGLDGDGGRNAVPKVSARSVIGRNEEVLGSLRERLTALEERLRHPLASQKAWEERTLERLNQLGEDLELHPVEVLKVTGPNRGSQFDVLADGTVYVPSPAGRSPSISAKIDVDNVTGLRLVFYPDKEFPKGGLGHGNERGLPGSFLLTGFSASATTLPADQVDLYEELSFTEATASNSHRQFSPGDALDPRDHNGWSPHPHNQQPQHITFQLSQPIDASKTPYVTAMLVWGGGPYGGGARLIAGKYRLFALTGNDDTTNVPMDVQEALRTDDADRSDQQRQLLQRYHARVAPELAHVRREAENIQRLLEYLIQPQPVMVMDVAESPRDTYILERGQYDRPTEKVEPGTPKILPPMPDDLPANRLGLARWLTQPNHPLTSRVAVNRIWQLLFGRGLVTTSADFGSQGEPPSHPELLDYLSTRFVQSGWNVKQLIKFICMSATYRQSSVISAELLQEDPQNQYLARGARFRLTAEFIRDQALFVSGLLNPFVGGPSVRPYQPPGLWKEVSHYGSTPATSQVFVQDHADALYRRSLYTYWKRTAPPPSMIALDAPTREVCIVQRSSTNTPLQALNLLNDPQFVEASRHLAARVLQNAGNDDARIELLFRVVLARMPTAAEKNIVQRMLARERSSFVKHPQDAHALLSVGESRNPPVATDEHAAWTSVATLMLNLSETITRE